MINKKKILVILSGIFFLFVLYLSFSFYKGIFLKREITSNNQLISLKLHQANKCSFLFTKKEKDFFPTWIVVKPEDENIQNDNLLDGLIVNVIIRNNASEIIAEKRIDNGNPSDFNQFGVKTTEENELNPMFRIKTEFLPIGDYNITLDVQKTADKLIVLKYDVYLDKETEMLEMGIRLNVFLICFCLFFSLVFLLSFFKLI